MSNWTPGLTLEEMEQDAITSAIRFYEGNLTAAAEALGINVRTMHNKVDEYKQRDTLSAARDEKRKRLESEKQNALKGDYGDTAQREDVIVERPERATVSEVINKIQDQSGDHQPVAVPKPAKRVSLKQKG